jgi:hypothetical protein
MEQNIVIYIGMWKALTLIAAVVLGAWYAGHRFGEIETKVGGFETRLTNLEGRLDTAFGSKSPIALLPRGEVILNESGLKNYIDERKDDLLNKCKNGNNMSNQYDIQENVFKFFDRYDFGDFEEKLKATAYAYGVGIETIRRVAGIYFRDICLEAYHFTPKDLDRPKTTEIRPISS